MTEQRVGLIGATSLVGACLLPLLVRAGRRVTAFSRRVSPLDEAGAEWRQLSPSPPVWLSQGDVEIEQWVCIAPIWVLPGHFAMLEAYGARRVVALSSTSRFTKDDSSEPEEQAIALRLADAESRVQAWAVSHGVEWIILRPTLIYGLGRDKNIAEIARFIRRFGFFPLFADGRGLRQPIHALDVAKGCFDALSGERGINRAYNISGAESIPYRDMVKAVFIAMGRQPRFIPVPLWTARLALSLVRLSPRYRHWSVAMLERMGRDLVFDHEDATRDLGFKPRAFLLSPEDVSA